MSFEEAISKPFEYIKVDHPALSKMDYIRIGMGRKGKGFTTLKCILGYLCMFDEDKLKDILLNGKWDIKEEVK